MIYHLNGIKKWDMEIIQLDMVVTQFNTISDSGISHHENSTDLSLFH